MVKPLLFRRSGSGARFSAILPPLTMPDTVTVRGEERPLKLRMHARARRMILRFDPRTGYGRLTVPPGTAPSAARAFLSQSARWIDDNAPPLANPDTPFVATLPIAGVPHTLVPTGKTRGLVRIGEGGKLFVPGAPDRIMPRIAAFLKTEAERVLTPQVLDISAQLGSRPAAIRYRDPRSQWGSCSSKRIITLSWRVMMAPPEAQAYLVAHEVAHLRHMDHSRRFWATVAALEPEWKHGQRALKRVEKDLLSIAFS